MHLVLARGLSVGHFQSCNLMLSLEEWTVIWRWKKTIVTIDTKRLLKQCCVDSRCHLRPFSYPFRPSLSVDHLVFELRSVTLCVLRSFRLVSLGVFMAQCWFYKRWNLGVCRFFSIHFCVQWKGFWTKKGKMWNQTLLQKLLIKKKSRYIKVFCFAPSQFYNVYTSLKGIRHERGWHGCFTHPCHPPGGWPSGSRCQAYLSFHWQHNSLEIIKNH